jgi:hypothetical protein
MCGEGERGDYFNVFCPMIVETEEFEGLASWLKIQDRFNITAFHPKSTGVAKWTGNSGRFLCYYFEEEFRKGNLSFGFKVFSSIDEALPNYGIKVK